MTVRIPRILVFTVLNSAPLPRQTPLWWHLAYSCKASTVKTHVRKALRNGGACITIFAVLLYENWVLLVGDLSPPQTGFRPSELMDAAVLGDDLIIQHTLDHKTTFELAASVTHLSETYFLRPVSPVPELNSPLIGSRQDDLYFFHNRFLDETSAASICMWFVSQR